MKIVDLQVIPFWVSSRYKPDGRVDKEYPRVGYVGDETRFLQTVTKVITDEGAEGYYFGGYGHGDKDGIPADQRAFLKGPIKSLVLGQDPYDREKIWHWMWVANMPENLLSILDMALWDLQARAFGVPVYKLLGGCRDKVKGRVGFHRYLFH